MATHICRYIGVADIGVDEGHLPVLQLFGEACASNLTLTGIDLDQVCSLLPLHYQRALTSFGRIGTFRCQAASAVLRCLL